MEAYFPSSFECGLEVFSVYGTTVNLFVDAPSRLRLGQPQVTLKVYYHTPVPLGNTLLKLSSCSLPVGHMFSHVSQNRAS